MRMLLIRIKAPSRCEGARCAGACQALYFANSLDIGLECVLGESAKCPSTFRGSCIALLALKFLVVWFLCRVLFR